MAAAAAVCAEIEKAGVSVDTISGADYIQACGDLVASAKSDEPDFVHLAESVQNQMNTFLR